MDWDSVLVYLILGGYLALNLAVGIFAFRKKAQSSSDYFLANRKVGTIVLFFTFIATNFSAFFFLGFAGAGYRIGYSFYAMMAFGTAFAALSFYFVGYKTWKLGKKHAYITPAEMIGDQSGSKILKFLFLGVMVLFTLPYLAIQPIGAGIIVEELSGGQISYFVGAAVLTVFIVFYVFMGGMRSVAITDVIQGILMFALMFAAVYFITDKLGGLGEANAQVHAIKPELFSREGGGDYFTTKSWFSSMILWVICVPMFPQMFMRFFISKDVKAFKTSTILYAVVPSVLFLCPVIIGVLGHLVFPGLEGQEADSILPMMLMELLPIGLAALIMVGAVAAFMSTLDSQLLALSTILTRDFYKGFIKKDVPFQKEVWIGRILIIALAIIGLLIALNPPDEIYEFVKYAFTGYSVLFPATIAVLYFKNSIPPWASIIAIVVGETFVLGEYFGWFPKLWFFGFDLVIPVIVVSAIILALGALVKRVTSSS